jgi:hypothetical protein
MTFTQFITSPKRKDPKPTFLHFVRQDRLWPHESNRLEDFESFLLSRLEDDLEFAIPELRQLWRDFAEETRQGKHDLDLALAAWGDYARHLRTCSGTQTTPCEASEELLARALDESSFDDTERPIGVVRSCDSMEHAAEGDDDEQDEEDGPDGDDDDGATELF